MKSVFKNEMSRPAKSLEIQMFLTKQVTSSRDAVREGESN